MKTFLDKHEPKITGVLSCFDRMLFRGYLPIMSGGAMAQFLSQEGIKFRDLKSFLTDHAATLKAHARAMAEREERPYIYLASAGSRKEQRAREIAEEDGISEGLVCVFSQLEPCNSFSFRFQQGRPFVNSARRKCLHIYYYYMDREFGLIHVMVQTCKVRKKVWREGQRVTEWVPMRKGVANLFRYREVSLASNGRYLEALAGVDDPSSAVKQLNTITQRKRTRAGQSVKAFNPLSPDDQRIFKALLSGANTINGFRNRDIRTRLAGSPYLRTCGRCVVKQSAKISRLLKRFHIYGLIAKVPRSRRWRLTKKGWALLSAAITLKEQTFPGLYAQASA